MKTQSNRSWLRSGFYLARWAVATACVPAMLGAATLSLIPAVQNVTPGSSFDVSVEISGLGNLSAPSLGAFDLDLLFNPVLVQFDSITFGDPILGDQLGPIVGSTSGFTANPNSVNAFSVSLDAPADLDSTQPDHFTLGSMHFTALSSGIGDFSLENLILGDSIGDPLGLDGVLGATVNIGPQGVPETNALWTTALTFGALAFAHCKSFLRRILS